MVQAQRLAQRELKDLLRAWREGDVSGRCALARADNGLDPRPSLVESHSSGQQGPPCDAVRLGQQPEQQVLGADVVVVEPPSLVLGEHDDLAA